MTEMIRRPGKIFATGNYPDKGFSMTPEELKAAVADFQPVPVDLEHLPTVLSGKLGMLESVSLSDDGNDLLGNVALPTWLHALLEDGNRKVSCTWDKATKRLLGLALVRTPRVSDAALMAAFSTAADTHDLVTIETEFAGSRHSAKDQGEMQAMHDLAVRQGATCTPMEQSKGATMSETMWDKFKAALSGIEAPAETVVMRASTDAPMTPAAPQPDPEKEALKKQLADMQAAADRTAAVAFADGEIAAGRALPAERDLIIAQFAQAAKDDTTIGVVTFADGKTSSRVEMLKATFAARIPHTLTTEQLAVPVQIVENKQTTDFATDADGKPVVKPVSPERIAELLGYLPEGKAILAGKNGAQK